MTRVASRRGWVFAAVLGGIFGIGSGTVASAAVSPAVRVTSIPSEPEIGQVFELRIESGCRGAIDDRWLGELQRAGVEIAGSPVEETLGEHEGANVSVVRLPVRAFFTGEVRVGRLRMETSGDTREACESEPVILRVRSALGSLEAVPRASKLVIPSPVGLPLGIPVTAVLIATALAYRFGARAAGKRVACEVTMIRWLLRGFVSGPARAPRTLAGGRQSLTEAIEELMTSGLVEREPATAMARLDALARDFVVEELGLVARERTTAEVARLARTRMPAARADAFVTLLGEIDRVKYARDPATPDRGARLCGTLLKLARMRSGDAR